jgi:hypothetical protein
MSFTDIINDTDNCFLKLVNHSLGKFYNRALQTILFTLMQPHTKKYEEHFLKHHEVWEAVTDVLEEHTAFI